MFIVSLIIIISLLFSYYKKQFEIYQFDFKHTLPLRGILALWVISCHLASNFDNSFLSSDLGVMGAPSVSCFFFLSGYGLLKSVQYKGAVYFNNFLKKRIGKLLIPLIIITSLFIVLQIATKDFQISYFYYRIIYGGSLIPNSWFVFAIIICYILFYISFHKRKSFLTNCIINTTLIILFMLFTIILGWDIWTLSLISFPLGLFIALYEYKIENYLRKYFPLCIFIIFAICFYCNYGLHINTLPIWWPIFCNTFPLMIYMTFRSINFSNIKGLNWLGKYSYEIYLIHGTLIYFTTKYIDNPYVLSIIAILGTLLLAPAIKIIYKH